MADSPLDIRSHDHVIVQTIDPQEPFFYLVKLFIEGDLRVTINQRVKDMGGLPLRVEAKIYPDRAVCEMVWFVRASHATKAKIKSHF